MTIRVLFQHVGSITKRKMWMHKQSPLLLTVILRLLCLMHVLANDLDFDVLMTWLTWTVGVVYVLVKTWGLCAKICTCVCCDCEWVCAGGVSTTVLSLFVSECGCVFVLLLPRCNMCVGGTRQYCWWLWWWRWCGWPLWGSFQLLHALDVWCMSPCVLTGCVVCVVLMSTHVQ